MTEYNPIITVALTIVLLVFVILYLRTLTLEQIREAVYNAFLTAETNFTGNVPDSNAGNIVIKVCYKQIISAFGLQNAIFVCMMNKKGGGLLYG